MNLITIAGRTIDVQKIAAIEWPDTGRQYTRLIFAVPLTSDQPYDMRLSEAQTEAFRWYLARIWQPVDIERAYQLRPEGRPPAEPATPPEVDREAFFRR